MRLKNSACASYSRWICHFDALERKGPSEGCSLEISVHKVQYKWLYTGRGQERKGKKRKGELVLSVPELSLKHL